MRKSPFGPDTSRRAPYVESQHVARVKIECARSSGRKLEYGLSAARGERETVRPKRVSNLQNATLTIEKERVDGKAHAQGVDAPARLQQQPVIEWQIAMAQQSDEPPEESARDAHMMRNGDASI